MSRSVVFDGGVGDAGDVQACGAVKGVSGVAFGAAVGQQAVGVGVGGGVVQGEAPDVVDAQPDGLTLDWPIWPGC